MANKKKKPNMIAEMGMRMGLRPDTRKKKKVPTPISKKEAFAKHKKKTGSYHKADPLHPMNRESMIGRKGGGSISSKGKSSHNRLY